MNRKRGIIDILREESNVTKPPILYKYYSFNKWTKRIFENNEIYFSSPAKLNDPFDSKINFNNYDVTRTDRKRFYREQSQMSYPGIKRKDILIREKRIMKQGLDLKYIPEGAKKGFIDIRDRMGIFCMTKDKKNILMWSHYTNEHAGFCVGFRTKNSFFSRAQKIIYGKDLPCINPLDLLESNRDKMLQKGVDCLLTKAKDWKYEKEWRIVEIDGVGIKNYPVEALACIILGCKILPENKKKIIEWCSHRKSQPDFFEAREKDSEFGLDIIPIS